MSNQQYSFGNQYQGNFSNYPPNGYTTGNPAYVGTSGPQPVNSVPSSPHSPVFNPYIGSLTSQQVPARQFAPKSTNAVSNSPSNSTLQVPVSLWHTPPALSNTNWQASFPKKTPVPFHDPSKPSPPWDWVKPHDWSEVAGTYKIGQGRYGKVWEVKIHEISHSDL